ncbi:MAG TPA: hypothetical protein VFV33_10370 [Gemmatimonadaceae bacterium]|nr:hypothetical protein [Gemmatimonadaceae bacterium]
MRTSAIAPRAIGEAVGGVAVALLATLAFVAWRANTERWASGLPGHALGMLGVALMLWAAFAYSWRKRHPHPGDTAMREAMQWHVFAGLLGPYLVILHSGLAFRGVAGVLTLAMVLVVASGVVGRAVYTAVPRRITVADPVRAALLDAEMARLEVELAELARAPNPDDARREALRAAFVSARHEQEHQRGTIEARGAGVGWRRLLSIWWFLHVPISLSLWVLAIAHVAGALYYGTLGR